MPWEDHVHDIGDDRDDHIEALEDRVDELVLENKKLKKQLADKPSNIDYKERYEKVLKSFDALLKETNPFL